MPSIRIGESEIESQPGETVLAALLRNDIEVPYSCRSGVCQTCTLRVLEGQVAPKAQVGLKETLRTQGYFLSCVCEADQDMVVAHPGADVVNRVAAVVAEKRVLNSDTLLLELYTTGQFDAAPGQFLHLRRPDGLIRSYSIADYAASGAGSRIGLHVRRLPGGAMTEWIHDVLAAGDSVEIGGPAGACFYVPGRPGQSILLIGTGSGLAPLWGIARDALMRGHEGQIALYHGSWTSPGLYLTHELSELAELHPNFKYYPCVDCRREGEAEHLREGRVDKIAFGDLADLKGWRVFLCGHPDLVAAARRRAFLSGASMTEIHADPFVLSTPAKSA